MGTFAGTRALMTGSGRSTGLLRAKGDNTMTRLQALASGAVGAGVVTLLNESVRRLYPHAPRMEVIGMRAIARSMRAADQEPPDRGPLFWLALLGDLVSNTVYYSLVGAGSGNNAWRRGALLGLSAGIGAVVLLGPLGLGRQPREHFPTTQAMTIGWYLAGGLAAAAASRLF